MTPEQLTVLLRHPDVKKEIASQVKSGIDFSAKKENANNKQMSKREKRG